jgi:uncharacterized membrane protein
MDITHQAIISKVLEEKQIDVANTPQTYQKLEITITSGNKKGDKIIIENGTQPIANTIRYKTNEKIMLSETQNINGYKEFIILDYNRHDGLTFLAIIFFVIIILISKLKGFTAILGMLFTFLVLFTYILPKISTGSNPLLIAISASIIIIPISFYLSHGINKKTTVAIIGSFITLLITGVLSFIFINVCRLSGLSSEEAGMLSITTGSIINMKGLLLAGIIIGVLGVLDDITISQSAIVEELVKTSPDLEKKELYHKAMNIGRDHIASMVNTLVLAYAGVSLPLLLLFINNPHPTSEILNYEFIAEEIVRTLVGSIGLVLAVPITTYLAACWYQKKQK